MEELESIVLTDRDRESLRRDSRHSADFLILGRRVRVSGNDEGVLRRFRALYEPFNVDVAGVSDRLIEYAIEADGALLVVAPPASYRITYPEVIQWPATVFGRIILADIRSHFLVHAGCVSRNGRAVIIAGASGMGKTTLSAHLVARGAGYLSDELAPISRADGWVEPFPLRLGIRPGPGRDLLQDVESVELRFRNDHKLLVDSEALVGQHAARRMPIAAIIFLSTDLSNEVITPGKRGELLRTWFTKWTPELAADITSTLAAEVVEVEPDDDLVRVDIKITALVEKIEPLRQAARRHGSLLAQIRYDDLGPLDRSRKPELKAIPAAAGAMELMKKIPTYLRTGFMESEFGGKISPMILELSRLVKDTRFYKLSPGRLQESIELVEALLA